MSRIECNNLPKYLNWFYPTEKYIEKACETISRDFNENSVIFKGKMVRGTYDNGKFSYEHIFKLDEENITDEERKSRAKYAPIIKPFLQLVSENRCCDKLKIWRCPDKGKSKIKIFCEKTRLFVILSYRPNSDHYVLLTAYPVNRRHTYSKILKEYNSLKNNRIL